VTSLYLIDDHLMVREGLRVMLGIRGTPANPEWERWTRAPPEDCRLSLQISQIRPDCRAATC
jgi:hypothetical protein